MKPALRFTFASLLVLALATLAVFALWSLVASPADGLQLVIDDEHVSLPALTGGNLLLAVGGVMLALLVVAVVVPLALLIGLGVPAFLLAFGLLIGLAALAAGLFAVCSPILLPLLFFWWLSRRAAARQARSSTTIAG